MDPNEGPWLDGFAIRGVGSLLAEDPVRVAPLRRMNFLVGRNNHGKSTLLRSAAYWTNRAPNSSMEGLRLETLVRVDERDLLQFYRRYSAPLRPLDQGLADGSFVRLDDSSIGVWVATQGSVRLNDMNAWQQALGLRQYHLSTVEGIFRGFTAPTLITIPAFRQLREGDTKNIETGEGLVSQLQLWERPLNPGSPAYKASQKRWLRLGRFLQDVLEDEGAALEVAANGTDLHVRLSQHGDMLHINNLGDGIKQVLMIAAACVHYDNHFICLEEPEIHLHPGLQRKLMRFLGKHTENQYLIATHSAHVLDTPDASIFHVTHDGTTTKVTSSVHSSDVQAICADLGYLASDLLQANYTIWVEGPSDRIYWRKWLKLVDRDLTEGIHYSLMTYGGRLIDGVNIAAEPDVGLQEDLVHLLKLGRSCSVIVDSDLAEAEGSLHPTVERLQEEASRPGAGHLIVFEWVRTVENLIPRRVFKEAALSLHTRAAQRLSLEERAFEDPFRGMRKGSFSKVSIARAVTERLTLGHMGERLLDEVRDLANRVRAANGFPALDDSRDSET